MQLIGLKNLLSMVHMASTLEHSPPSTQQVIPEVYHNMVNIFQPGAKHIYPIRWILKALPEAQTSFPEGRCFRHTKPSNTRPGLISYKTTYNHILERRKRNRNRKTRQSELTVGIAIAREAFKPLHNRNTPSCIQHTRIHLVMQFEHGLHQHWIRKKKEKSA